VDWAVFQQTLAIPNNVPVGMSGYALAGAQATSGYLYTYQAYELPQPDGIPPAPLSSIGVMLGTTQVQNIGNFVAAGISGDPVIGQGFHLAFPPMTAQWTFDGVVAGNETVGLAFWSPNPPVDSAANTIDDGTTGIALPVPAPNPQNVPEPTTLALALMGLLGFAFHLTRRRHRRRA
jgi:hypothetical protein